MSDRPFTEQAATMLEAIREGSSNGDWIKRQDIAKRLKKSTLGTGDLLLLDYLTEQGQIEARKTATRAPSGRRWEYRIKEG